MIGKSDPDTSRCLAAIETERKAVAQRFEGIRTVLVILSAAAMVYDVEALRQKIHLTYPDAAVFFGTQLGRPVGATAPRKVDLVIDFTGPGQRQCLFHAIKLSRMSRHAVGRDAGLFRKRAYGRIFDEKEGRHELPSDLLAREQAVQKKVLQLAGIPYVQAGDSAPDRGRVTPLELPLLRRS